LGQGKAVSGIDMKSPLEGRVGKVQRLQFVERREMLATVDGGYS
jgi:hypothetical protein